MNIFDFTKTGGFPVTQNRLKFMQDATAALHKWFTYADDLYTPGTGSQLAVILSGVEYDGASSVTDGFVAIDGEVLPFVTDPAGGNQFVIVENKTNISYFGGVPKDAQIERYVQLVSSGGTAMSAFKRFEVVWAERFGYKAVYGSWTGGVGGTIAVNAYNVTGDLIYRRNLLSRTLHISATLSQASAQTVNNPRVYHLLATLPAGFIPAVKAPFQCPLTNGNPFKDVDAVEYMNELNAYVNDDGELWVRLVRPEAGITDFSFHLNHVITLD